MELVESRQKKSHKTLFISSFFKRLIDIIGGIVGCVLTVIIAIIIKLSYMIDGDTGSVFFTQERIGKDGKLFKIYKFRSMVPHAEDILSQLMIENEKIREEYMRNKKLENDPRVTKLGKFIRKTSLDEFPQFFNVLLGNMSLVGPRPYLLREIEDMGLAYNEIIKVKPGITGPWQVGGRSDLSFDERIEIDLDYINQHSLSRDIRILISTFSSVLLHKGAK